MRWSQPPINFPARVKAARWWPWPLISIQWRAHECWALYQHLSTRSPPPSPPPTMVIKHTKNFAQLQVKPSAAVPDRRRLAQRLSLLTAATHTDSSWNFDALLHPTDTFLYPPQQTRAVPSPPFYVSISPSLLAFLCKKEYRIPSQENSPLSLNSIFRTHVLLAQNQFSHDIFIEK